MPLLLQRRLRCFYCNGRARNDQGGIPRTWSCPHCEAVNHLDQRGQITDPPAQATAQPRRRVQFAPERSPPPTMAAPPPSQSPFCDTCERNQAIVANAMAEYIPDEEDPDYDRYVATADAYRAELETRYPQVCENCIGRVRDQVRAAGYAARTDHLRRILENSKQTKLGIYTSRQIWTLRTIRFAKWVYAGSILVGTVWHTLGAAANLKYPAAPDKTLDFAVICLLQVIRKGRVDTFCFNAPSFLKLVQGAIVADLLTIWWNPKLEQMAQRPGGRMHRLIPLWFVRITILGLRAGSFLFFQNIPKDSEELQFFRTTHGIMVALTLISAIVSWCTVSIHYQSTASFMQPIEPYLPVVPPRQGFKEEQKLVRPKSDIFDSMAQSFTSSFNAPDQDDQQVDLPPSPTLTATSVSRDSDIFTATSIATNSPSRTSISTSADSMDWMPTQRRFGKTPVGIQPPIWSKEPEKPPPKEPHSIFAKKDPNPFRHKVPAFPKNRTQQKRDPWKSGIWAPAPAETKNTFLADIMKKGGDAEIRERLQQDAVPKNVKKDEELFGKPKLNYDYQGYVGEKSTGLEDSFHNLFHE